MSTVKIRSLTTTATTTASDDFLVIDGTTNSTRKLSAATPAFLTSVTVPTVATAAGVNLNLATGTAASDKVLIPGTLEATAADGLAASIGTLGGASVKKALWVGGIINVAGHTTFEGVTSTGATGTGKLVYDTSPSLTTPALGTPSALLGTNITGTAAGLTAGNVTTNANLTGDVTSVGNATSIAAGVIVNADINASAAIVDTKLDTIATALKVSNSATTAASANTASAIVARDASGNFSAGTVSAALTGNASTATALATGRTIAITGDLAYTSPSFDGTGNVTAAGTLASVASAGTSGGSTAIPVVTINAKGLTTSITTAAVIAPASTLSGNTLASGVTASSLTSLGTIASLAVTAGTISTTPSASTDIANKLYVDTVAQGLDAKASCIAATTANITLSGTQTIDGISVIAADRVLVKDQTLSQNNGIYLCAAGAWTRTTDADTWDELTSAFVFIETGTVNADTGWVCTANAGGTLGTTALPWSQFSGAGSYTASTGLTLTGTAFSLTAPVTVALGGTNATSAGIAAFNNISGFTAAGATGTTSTNLVFSTSPTITSPTITGGALNGTLGATTPSTVAATTISATGNSALSGLTLNGAPSTLSGSGFEISGGALPYILSYNRTGNAFLNMDLRASTVTIKPSDSTVGVFSSTGLAVTGALSATGALSTTIGGDIITLGASGVGYLQTFSRADANYIRASSAGGYFVFETGGANNRAVINDTGLAVTGTLSATGILSLYDGATERGRLFTNSVVSGFEDALVIQCNGDDIIFTTGASFTTGEVGRFTSAGLAVTGTLSATSNGDVLSIKYLSNAGSALLAWKNEAGTTLWDIGGGIVASQDELAIRRQGSAVALFTSTGLAVTGASTASAGMQVTGSLASALVASSTGIYTTGGFSRIITVGPNNATSGTLEIVCSSLNASVLASPATFTSTGLAVTGTLSTTGTATIGGAVTIGGTAQLTGSAPKLEIYHATAVKHNINGSDILSVSGTGAAIAGTLSATGTSTLVAINSSGVIENSSNNGQPFRATGATTGESVLNMTNTGGSAIFGQERSTGNYLIVGSTAYDTVVRGPSGIAFSANAGSNMQMRISSAGAAITGTLSVASSTSGASKKILNEIYGAGASNNATVDVWVATEASPVGSNFLVGNFYVYVTGASGANAFSGVYTIVATGNGTTDATLNAVSTVTRGTSPVSTVQIANDGVAGRIKLTVTYINNSGVVTGGTSYVSFVGQIH